MSAKGAAPKAVATKKASKSSEKDVKPLKINKPTPVHPVAPADEWLYDASLEAPVASGSSYGIGQRELEFSVGMRQQEDGEVIHSELRARALIHAGGEVLAVVEASYVKRANRKDLRPDLPQYLYTQLKPHLISLFALAGHTPPLPESLAEAGA